MTLAGSSVESVGIPSLSPTPTSFFIRDAYVSQRITSTAYIYYQTQYHVASVDVFI